ncbi:tripartite tricarboxylate transporter TctB family protein [Sedimentitalea sp. JM2-8]|uniref:Tripartite tricarboxylate transporter TctB family protein n=1 Tax=Sedimentitalea xiamensis TaxID=3050037 RepID=A0ABT7FEZ1_9RHOB|nr:tripartite tricarboxylate transporter TctB family protein [Sedimentitalea xiamensis]MDK3073620.1 tripartite tricarboxylate transporter TctB family protein [Sedimentitalea xiamensis]
MRFGADMAVAVAAVTVGTAILLLLPAQISGAHLGDISNMDSPAFFPILSGAFLILSGIALGAQKAIQGPRDADRIAPFFESGIGIIRLLSIAALLVVYLFAIRMIGMVVSSMVLILVMAPMLNFRNLRVILPSALIFPFCVYVLFEKVLRILLPHGGIF